MRTMFIFWIGIVSTATVLLGGGASAGEDPANPGANPMTFGSLLKSGITSFIDKEFTLKAKLTWKYIDAKIPEDPTPEAKLRNKAGPLMVMFEGEEFKGAKKNFLHAIGPDMSRVAAADGREVYVFKGVTLAIDKERVLTVRLKLRAGFTKAMLDNPAFVKQSNNPVYWNQTFELEIINIE